MNLAALVLAECLHRGEVTAAQLQGIIGRHIPAAQAATAARRLIRHWRSTKPAHYKPLLDIGKRHLISNVLCHLRRQGKLRRLRRGVYAVPAPKLFRSA